MKTNEVPEKIYLQVCGDCNIDDCNDCRFEDLEGNITWCKDKIFEKDMEYTCTDVFIEKACDWFRRIDYDDSIPPFETTEGFIEGFKNYMKRE